MKFSTQTNAMETNAEVVSQDFTIGDAAIIIEMLRKHAYQHRIRTLVQEYMSNARDAVREAKTSRRVVVSVPNDLSPVFKVRDFGPGITPHRIANVFIRYGISTKRNTNGQTGGFGIGAKSAWCYTDSFTIVSITGGVKRTYVAHIGATNEGRLDLIAETDTTEETGTEIQVAVKPNNIHEFRESIFRACYFWKESEYPEFLGLRTDEVPQRHVKGLEISKEFEINQSSSIPSFVGMNWSDRLLLVIDGIPYSINDSYISKVSNLSSLTKRCVGKIIAHIGNGVVEVAMSREAISDSEETVATLNGLAGKLQDQLMGYVANKFKNAKTTTEWISTYKELSKSAYVDDYSKFGNYQIAKNMIESADFSEIEISHVSLRRKRRAKTATLEHTPGRFINLTSVGQVFFVDVGDEPMITQNKRLREYIEKSNITDLVLVSAKETVMPDPAWVRPQPVDGQPMAIHPTVVKTSLAKSNKTLARIKADFNARGISLLPYTPTVRVPKAKRDRTKEMFTIHECTGHSKHPNTTTIEQVQSRVHEYLYVSLNEYKKLEHELADLVEYAGHVGYTLCALTDDSIEMVAGCKHFKPYADWKTNFKVDAKLLSSMKWTKAKNSKYAKLFDGSTVPVKDRHMAKMLLEYKGLSHDGRVIIPGTLMKWAENDLAEFLKDDEKFAKLIKEVYPLIVAVERGYGTDKSTSNELVYYINAKARIK